MKKCVNFLSDIAGRVKTITIGVLFHSQSISIKRFIWLNTHFKQFYWLLFRGSCEIGNIFACFVTRLNIKKLFFLLGLCTNLELWPNFWRKKLTLILYMEIYMKLIFLYLCVLYLCQGSQWWLKSKYFLLKSVIGYYGEYFHFKGA